MRKIALIITALFLAAFGMFFVLASSVGATPPSGGISNPARLYAACAEEDGSGGTLPCIWDATVRGNHTGSSYIVKPDGSVNYLFNNPCTTTVKTNCKVTTDASSHYSEWVRGNGDHVGAYAPGYGPLKLRSTPVKVTSLPAGRW